MSDEFDIVVAGGGLTGACLALALKDSGFNMALVEAQTPAQMAALPAADRALALAAGSVEQLDRLGIWREIERTATPIKRIHVSDRGHFGKVRLSAEQEGVTALGYVLAARDLEGRAAEMVRRTPVRVLSPARITGAIAGREAVHLSLKQGDRAFNVTAGLLIGADGGNSSVRRLLEIPERIFDYGQTALITTVGSSLPNRHTAYERFTESGPLALLPAGTRNSAVIWTRTHAEADGLMAGGDDDFLAELQRCFGYRLGRLTLTAPKKAFPVPLIYAETQASRRAVVIGNAAQQLHPVAGQGFNLGLRDALELADHLARARRDGADIGAEATLQAYVRHRRRDRDRTIFFTDRLVQLFSSGGPVTTLARNAGMVVLDQLPAAKSLLARFAMGGTRRNGRS